MPPPPTMQPSRWDALVKILDPMTPLTASMAAALLGRKELDLEYAAEGDPEFIAHEPTDRGRCFRLGDVLVAAGEDPLTLEGGKAMSREDAEAAMTRRVGPPAKWFNAEDYASEAEARKAKAESGLLLSLLGAGTVPKRPRGRPSEKRMEAEAAKMGGRIHRLKGFATLGDFVLNALPNDVWIVAKPAGGRPYDFLDALLAGDNVPWQTMTLTEYLDAIRDGARSDAGTEFACDEAEKIASAMVQTGA